MRQPCNAHGTKRAVPAPCSSPRRQAWASTRSAARSRGRLNRQRETIEIALKPEEGSLSNWIHENCEVVERRPVGEGVTALRIRVPPEKRERLARLAGPARLRLAAE